MPTPFGLGFAPHVGLGFHPHLDARDVRVYPEAVDAGLDALRIEHQIFARNRLARSTIRIVRLLMAALHAPLGNFAKSNAPDFRRRCLRYRSYQHHRCRWRGFLECFNLLDGMIQNQGRGFVVAFGLARGRLGKCLLFKPSLGSVGLHLPALAILFLQLPAQFLGLSPQPLFLFASCLCSLPLVTVPSCTSLYSTSSLNSG